MLKYQHIDISIFTGRFKTVQVEYALSEVLGTRNVSDFRFQVLEYWHRLYQLSIPNLKSKIVQNLKLEHNVSSSFKALQMVDFCIKDAHWV
jgi:hypothetical protein